MRPPNAPPPPASRITLCRVCPVPPILYTNRHAVCFFTALFCGIPMSRSTWQALRRVTPPISPTSGSVVHGDQAASMSRTSFSARESCTARQDLICSTGSGVAALKLPGQREYWSGFASLSALYPSLGQYAFLHSKSSSVQGMMSLRDTSGATLTGLFPSMLPHCCQLRTGGLRPAVLLRWQRRKSGAPSRNLRCCRPRRSRCASVP